MRSAAQRVQGTKSRGGCEARRELVVRVAIWCSRRRTNCCSRIIGDFAGAVGAIVHAGGQHSFGVAEDGGIVLREGLGNVAGRAGARARVSRWGKPRSCAIR